MLFSTRFALVSAIFLMFAFISCNQQTPINETQTTAVDQPVKLQHPDWSKNAVIYEVNIRQYTPEGTFTAFEEHLPRLKELGVDILWLMPIFPIGEKNRKGTLGSYYAVKNYTEVNPEFGTMKDFNQLVQIAHEMGFKVILDWVANHTAWDNPWVEEHPEWYTRDSLNQIVSPYDWTDVADLNYDEKPLWDAMTGTMKFWVTESDVDGFRCDVAEMVPTEFWNQTRAELDKVKPVFMLAEAEKPEHHQKAFDMSYAWELHHIFNQMAKGEKNASAIESYFKKNDTVFPSDAYRMTFLTNHDENSWNGTIQERLGDASSIYAVLMYTLPGMPLIYSGQEAGLNKRLSFFEKDEIDWNINPSLATFYSKLNALKKNNLALWNGDSGSAFQRLKTNGGNHLLAFVREKEKNKIVVICNLNKQPMEIALETDEVNGIYTNYFTGETVSLSKENPVNMEPLTFFVYVQNK